MKTSGTTVRPSLRPRRGQRALPALPALLALLALGPAFGQTATTDPFFSNRGYYLGFVGEAPIQMDLSVDGIRASGWYFYDEIGRYIDLRGSLEGSTLRLEESVEGRPTGVFEGEAPWSPEGTVALEGTWRGPDGRERPFRLTRVADFASLAFTQSTIESRRSLPFFVAEELRGLNSFLHDTALPELIAFFEDGRELQLSGDFYLGWSLDERTTIRYLDDDLLSAMSYIYTYTGGAHPNTYYRSFNLWRDDGGFRDIVLADLFAPGSDYLSRLSELILERLREAGASGAVDGYVAAFEEVDLAVFEISPEGLTFAFAPYQVASYAEGPFFVELTYQTIADLIAPEGPLGRFLNGE